MIGTYTILHILFILVLAAIIVAVWFWDFVKKKKIEYKLKIKRLDNAIINVRLSNAREWKELQDRCNSFEKRFHEACAQNYCTMCGNILDGYVPPVVKEGEEDEDNTSIG